MADIEVVIKIPEEEYEMIVNSEDCGLHTLTRAIAHGAILPKGHGRLIDANELIKSMDNNYDKFGYSARYGLERLHKDDKGYIPYVRFGNMVIAVNKAPTIIEADKAESEDKE